MAALKELGVAPDRKAIAEAAADETPEFPTQDPSYLIRPQLQQTPKTPEEQVRFLEMLDQLGRTRDDLHGYRLRVHPGDRYIDPSGVYSGIRPGEWAESWPKARRSQAAQAREER